MLSLLIDFCNIGSWDIETVASYIKEHDLCDFCENKVCSEPEGPACDISEAELARLQGSQELYQDFLDKCINGHLDLDFINHRLQYLHGEAGRFVLKPDGTFEADPKSQRFFHFVSGSNSWKPEVHFRPLSGRELEAFLDASIVRTLLTGEGEVFSKVKKCGWCKNYLVFTRQTKKYCSDKCRLDFNNDKDRRSGRRHEYYKKKREEGNEKYF